MEEDDAAQTQKSTQCSPIQLLQNEGVEEEVHEADEMDDGEAAQTKRAAEFPLLPSTPFTPSEEPYAGENDVAQTKQSKQSVINPSNTQPHSEEMHAAEETAEDDAVQTIKTVQSPLNPPPPSEESHANTETGENGVALTEQRVRSSLNASNP